MLPVQGVRELRSCMPCNTVENKKFKADSRTWEGGWDEDTEGRLVSDMKRVGRAGSGDYPCLRGWAPPGRPQGPARVSLGKATQAQAPSWSSPSRVSFSIPFSAHSFFVLGSHDHHSTSYNSWSGSVEDYFVQPSAPPLESLKKFLTNGFPGPANRPQAHCLGVPPS